MKVKLGQIVESQGALGSLATRQLFASTAFQIGRTLKQISQELEVYEASRKDLLEKLGQLDKETHQYTFENGNREKFDQEYKALIENEIELNVSKIKLADLKDIKMNPQEMLLLEWLIDEEDVVKT